MSDDVKRDDGGQAFPGIASIHPQYYDDDARRNGDTPSCYTADTTDGMSLRDWFAGQALTGLYANDEAMSRCCVSAIQEATPLGPGQAIARACYGLADAMLEARKR